MRRPQTLRSRLVLIVVALMAGVSVVVGAVSVMALHGYLVGQLDGSLRQSAGISQDSAPPTQTDQSQWERPDEKFYAAPGQGIGTISGIVRDNVLLVAGYPDASGNIRFLTTSELERLAKIEVDGQPHTMNLGKELGQYRVIAGEPHYGEVVLTALPLDRVNQAVGQLALILALVAAAGVALAAAAATFIVGFALRPLNRVASTAASVADLPLDRGDVDIAVRVPEQDTDTSTEVGQVGSALNRLLSHVGSALSARQRSEDKVRRFVADASHELRTPLASIRGYSELTRRMNELPDEVGHNLGRIESEAIRMTNLVEDLLLLARLDSQPELRRDEVDLSLVVVEAVGDAHVAGPDHVWSLELPDEPVAVTGDDARLRQIVLNLLANARIHTPAGTTVLATLQVEGPDAVIRVRDDGPGIPAEQLDTLFERFTRGDSSRTRATGSTGLGLSIVKAVAEAHGGSVEVASRPGETVFSVRLPVSAETESEAPRLQTSDVRE